MIEIIIQINQFVLHNNLYINVSSKTINKPIIISCQTLFGSFINDGSAVNQSIPHNLAITHNTITITQVANKHAENTCSAVLVLK
jgi:hypothetical protein